MEKQPRTGVLIVNLGTPDSTSVGDVRRYLREFLSDPRVIDMHPLGRWLLLNLIILPFRPRRSAEAYEKIWSKEGSPLLAYGRRLVRDVAETLGSDDSVVLAMRYGNPSIEAGFDDLLARDLDALVVLPLFPQYATATNGSVIAKIFEILGRQPDPPAVRVVPPFYAHPAFIDAIAEVAAPILSDFRPDHVVMSFHGLPESQVRALDESGKHCFEREDCCDAIGDANRHCYRAHCFATARAIAESLDLSNDTWSVAFQSRLGRARWLEPDLVTELPELAARGVERVAVICPAFVADCLETVEEVGIRARDQWKELGGDALELIPCVNAHPAWVRGVCDLVKENTVGVDGRSQAGHPDRSDRTDG